MDDETIEKVFENSDTSTIDLANDIHAFAKSTEFLYPFINRYKLMILIDETINNGSFVSSLEKEIFECTSFVNTELIFRLKELLDSTTLTTCKESTSNRLIRNYLVDLLI